MPLKRPKAAVIFLFITVLLDMLALGLIAGSCGFLMYGLADDMGFLLLAIPVGSLWGLAGPALQGMMTRIVSASEQGKLQGANTSLTGIAQLIGLQILRTAPATLVSERP